MLEQFFIGITGVFAIWLSQSDKDSTRRWACIFGLLGQPLWFYVTYKAQQWGIFCLCFFYTYAWWHGFKNNWLDHWRGKLGI